MQYSENILGAISRTPLVKLNKVVVEISALVLAKVETFKSGNSIKDRMVAQMIEDAEFNGSLKPGGTIIETASENIEMRLALAANVKGYKLIYLISDKHSKEKRDILQAIGVKVVVCPADVDPSDLRSCFSVSKRLSEEIPNSCNLRQNSNISNSLAHFEQTATEIWEQTEGKITHFVSTVRTGNTILGIGKYLKEKNPNIKLLGVQLQGLKSNQFQENDFFSIDIFLKVTDEDATLYTQKLTLEEGIFAGKSAGAAIKGMLQIKEQFKPDDVIVVLFHD